MIYKTVYEFQIMTAVREGHDVYVLDRKTADTYDVKVMPAAELAELLNEMAADPERFEGWYAEEVAE